jgi:hypothetical protein
MGYWILESQARLSALSILITSLLHQLDPAVEYVACILLLNSLHQIVVVVTSKKSLS